MNSIQPDNTKELVINWHITEACNYSCQYCYAKWKEHGAGKELIHDSAKTRTLLEEIQHCFSPHNPLNRDMNWDSLRLNLAGGEPLLYPDKALRTIKLAHQMGFKVSIITNGSRLTHSLMTELAPYLSILGLSMDSFADETNRKIGRADRHSNVPDMDSLTDVLALGRLLNPDLKIKINTVVNTLNWRDDMNEAISNLAPDKWKVLRMLPTVTNDLAVSDNEFAAFVNRHQTLDHVMRAEDNADMTESYIMIDPHGRFFQNSEGQKPYDSSLPILEVGATTAFSTVNWSSLKFCSRYSDELTGSHA
jgi:radical S-adenosyl methionine domain-containing protein 2